MTQFANSLTEIFKQAEKNKEINIFFDAELNPSYQSYRYSKLEVINSLDANKINVEFVTQVGGEEEGRDYYSVYKFTKDSETIYIKFQGWYESYNGSEYEHFYFAEPTQVMTTVYNEVKK